jgi:hypothetical protein
MTSLTGVTYTGVKPFDSEIVGELKTTISQIIAKKLSIKQDVIEDIKTAEELFPISILTLSCKLSFSFPLWPPSSFRLLFLSIFSSVLAVCFVFDSLFIFIPYIVIQQYA